MDVTNKGSFFTLTRFEVSKTLNKQNLWPLWVPKDVNALKIAHEQMKQKRELKLAWIARELRDKTFDQEKFLWEMSSHSPPS